MCEQYNVIVEQENVTVMSSYTPLPREERGGQSEEELELSFIKQLTEQGYEYVNITSEAQMISNLRKEIDRLNGLTLSDSEWKELFEKRIASQNFTIEDKTNIIQRSEIINIKLDDKSSQNIKLIDKKDIHNNHLQVLNQYVPEGGAKENRYDVTILVNGLPLVHCELKKRGVKKLKVVYSEEKPIRPIEDMAISCRAHCICPPGAKHKCTERRDIPGSVAFVPSVVGLIIAGEVVKDLTAECRR